MKINILIFLMACGVALSGCGSEQHKKHTDSLLTDTSRIDTSGAQSQEMNKAHTDSIRDTTHHIQ